MSKSLNKNAHVLINKLLNVVDTLDVVKADEHLEEMYNFFSKYQHRVFEEKDRLVILHHDTDYYNSTIIGNGNIGNTAYNIIKIIAHFNISTYHVLILTNNTGGKQQNEFDYLCDIFNIGKIKTIECNLFYYFPEKVFEKPALNLQKDYLFSSLNGVSRTHRKTLLCSLLEKNLLENGIVSWGQGSGRTDNNNDNVNKIKVNKIPEDLYLRTIIPKFTRVNEELSLCKISKQQQIKYQSTLESSFRSDSICGNPNGMDTRWRADFLQQSFVFLVRETVGNYPHVFLTEKTWKAMVSMMPFMMIGAPGTLKYLKNNGFKTFDFLWDESYDEVENLYERIDRITDILVDLRTQNLNQLFQKCIPILEHNFAHIQKFQKSQLDTLKIACR